MTFRRGDVVFDTDIHAFGVVSHVDQDRGAAPFLVTYFEGQGGWAAQSMFCDGDDLEHSVATFAGLVRVKEKK